MLFNKKLLGKVNSKHSGINTGRVHLGIYYKRYIPIKVVNIFYGETLVIGM